jgi:LacI family transcriptional regulator
VAEDRVAGFRGKLEEAGIPWSETLWLQCRPRLLEGRAAAQAALDLDPRPTAFVCFNDLVAFGAMNALRASGLEPGRDVGVVGIGGTDEAMAIHPALTTVSDNPANIGAIAAETLLNRLSDPQAPPRHIMLEPKLVIRESCGGPIG